MLKSNFIADGITEQGYVEDQKGLFLPCRFTYIPALTEERMGLYEGFKSLSASDCERCTADFLAKKIKTWDITDSKGQVVPIKPANLLRLRPALFQRINSLVCGHDASDTDPQWDSEKKIELAKVKYESALSESSVQEIREGEAAKN